MRKVLVLMLVLFMSLGRGNWADAGLSAAAMIPVVGQFSTAGKWGKNAIKYSDEAAAGLRHLPAPKNTKLYRAVSHGEYDNLMKTRQFSQGPNSMGGMNPRANQLHWTCQPVKKYEVR